MNMFRRLSLKALGVNIENSASITNLLAKKVLQKMGMNDQNSVFQAIRKYYRKLGGRIRLVASNSFNGEDLVLAKYLPETNGSYLDIGSGHPKLGSNTWLFYNRGWSGITIDPLKKMHRLHLARRSRDKQFNVCITNLESSEKTVNFYQYPADEYSTTSESRYLELLTRGEKPNSVIKVVTLKIRSLGLATTPLEPYLLDIDTEGNELSILESIDWNLFKPRVIAIEEWESPIYVPTAVRNYLEKLGYALESRTVVTSIYVHREYLATREFN